MIRQLKIRCYKALYQYFYQKYEPLIRVANGRTSTRGEWLKVSDHAVWRYIERVHGINKEDCVRAILSDNLPVRVQRFGQGEYEVGDFRVRVLNNVVVTVLDGQTNTSYRPLKANRDV